MDYSISNLDILAREVLPLYSVVVHAITRVCRNESATVYDHHIDEG